MDGCSIGRVEPEDKIEKRMNKVILEEHGRFWWHDEPIPEGFWAPENSQIGTLKIDVKGSSILEMHGFFPGDSAPSIFDNLSRLRKEHRCIQGIIKDSNKYILLLGVQGAGGSSRTHGISYPRYFSGRCLISDDPFPQEKLMFQQMEINLKGFEQWLRLGSIKFEREPERVSATYEKPQDISYPLEEGEFFVQYDLHQQYNLIQKHTLSMSESAFIVYHPKEEKYLEDMEKQFLLFQDLLILLTGSDFPLEWPTLLINKSKCQYYFSRMKGSSNPPEWQECWTNFIQLQSNFGKIFSSWREKREIFGPGFYLYIGTLRKVKLYPEHRFMNMIWGLEAFDRRKFKEEQPQKTQEKIQRILGEVKLKKDRNWLQERLKFAHEPALEARIRKILSVLPFNFKKGSLQKFSEKCARYRHDITHFGGQRNTPNYSDFVIDLVKMSKALSYLFHAVILLELSVDKEIIKSNPLSWKMNHSLVEAGLLDKEILHIPNSALPLPDEEGSITSTQCRLADRNTQ